MLRHFPLRSSLVAAVLVAGCLTVRSGAAPQTWSIRSPYNGSMIVLQASDRFAGAIDSLTWNGMQFIDSTDHGRELQSASQFNNRKECYNPTEAGSSRDGRGDTSTSQLISIKATGATLTTRSRMAYWVPPGGTSPSCQEGPTNTTALSDHELSKTVSIAGNVITHDITYHVPRDYGRGVFEALTAYLPEQFSKFWSYDPATDSLTALEDKGYAERPLPVIMATPSGSHALGVYSPDLPQPNLPDRGYGHSRYAHVVKWNCVFRQPQVSAGDHKFRCYSVIGTLDDVRAGIQRLYRAKAKPGAAHRKAA